MTREDRLFETFCSILSSDISLETSFQDVSNNMSHDRIGQERKEILPSVKYTVFPDSDLFYTSPHKHLTAAHLEQNSNALSPVHTSPWKNNIRYYDNPFQLQWPFDEFSDFVPREAVSGPPEEERLPETFNCLIDSACPTKFTNQYLQTYRAYLNDLVKDAACPSASGAKLTGDSELDLHATETRLPMYVGKSRECRELWDKLETTKNLWPLSGENANSTRPEKHTFEETNAAYSVPALNPKQSPLMRPSCRESKDKNSGKVGQHVHKDSIPTNADYKPNMVKPLKLSDIGKQDNFKNINATATKLVLLDSRHSAVTTTQPLGDQNFALGDAQSAKRKVPTDEYRQITKTNEWTIERQTEQKPNDNAVPEDKKYINKENVSSPKNVVRRDPSRQSSASRQCPDNMIHSSVTVAPSTSTTKRATSGTNCVNVKQFSHHTSAFWSDSQQQIPPYYQHPLSGHVHCHPHHLPQPQQPQQPQQQQQYTSRHHNGPVPQSFPHPQQYNQPIPHQYRPPQPMPTVYQPPNTHSNNPRFGYTHPGLGLQLQSSHQTRYPAVHPQGPVTMSQNKPVVEKHIPQQKQEHFKQFVTPSNNYSNHQFIMPRVPPPSNLPWQTNIPPHATVRMPQRDQTPSQHQQTEHVAVDDEVWYINGVPHHHARPVSQTSKVNDNQTAPIVQPSGYQQCRPWSVNGSAPDVRFPVPPNVYQPPLQMPPPLPHQITQTFPPPRYAYHNINMHNSIPPPPLPNTDDNIPLSNININNNNNNESEDSSSPLSSSDSIRSSPTDPSSLESSSSCSSLTGVDQNYKATSASHKIKQGKTGNHITVLGSTMRADVKRVLKRKRKKETRPSLLKII